MFSELMAPLIELSKAAAPKKLWCTREVADAFHRVKDVLCLQPVVHAPNFGKPFLLQRDASNTAIGAVLSQSGSEHPVAYISRKLHALNEYKL